MKIYIDADASPVQDEVIAIAAKYDVFVTLVKSFSHFSNEEESSHVKTIYVDKGADMADFKIIQHAKRGDIIVTQDYGLASLGLGKGCLILHHKGFQYTDDNIDRLLSQRHANAMARRGGFRTKGPKKFSDEERSKFTQLLERIINENQSTR